MGQRIWLKNNRHAATISGCTRQLVFHIDNSAVETGWCKGAVKGDETASILLRSIHIITCFLGARVTVLHVKRMSHELAALADTLSRDGKIDREESYCLHKRETLVESRTLSSWLRSPAEDWSLPSRFLDEVKSAVMKTM